MSENVENLILEHLKRFQAGQDRIERELRELKTRQTETLTAVLSLRRDQVHDAEVTAHMQVQMDTFNDRIERIERRLELQA